MSGPVDPDPKAVAPPARELYPGAPLRAVAMEVYFPGLLDAVARLGELQRKHFQELGRLYVPRTELAEGADLDRHRPVLLLGKDRGMAVANDQVAVITYDYAKGYDELVRWGLPMLREALDTVGVLGALTRVRFRYENLIDAGTDGTVDLGRFFRIVLPRGPGATPTVASGVHLAWRQVWPGGFVSVDLSVDDEPGDDGDDVLVVSIVAERPGPLALADLEEALGQAHAMALWTWEELITDEFRETLRRPKQ